MLRKNFSLRLASFLITTVLLATLLVLPVSAVTVTFEADGTLVKDGQKWWPFGIFHDGSDAGRSASAMVGDFDLIGSAGYDLVHPLSTPASSTTGFRQKAQQLGIYIFAQGQETNLSGSVQDLKNDPMIIGYDVGDDYSTPKSDPAFSPSELQTRHNQLKAIKPTWLSMGSTPGHFNYNNAPYDGKIDVYGNEIYPIGNKSGQWATELEENIAVLFHWRYIYKNRPVLAELQTFKWSGGRYPTASETRNMHYATFISDYNGILSYSFFDGGKILPEEGPDQWNELKKLIPEMKSLAPVILNGTLTMYDPVGHPDTLYPHNGGIKSGTNAGRIHAGLWLYNNEVYAIVLNTHNSQSQTANVPLPKTFTNPTVTQVFNDARYGSGMTVTGGNKLTGLVAPEAVHVYKVTEGGGGGTTPPPVCKGDYNADQKIDVADFALLSSSYKKTGITCSLDLVGSNCYLDIADFQDFANRYKKPCSS